VTTDMNAEHALIGIALAHPEITDELDLAPADFAEPRCEAVWAIIGRLHAEGAPAGPITVQAQLPPAQRTQAGPWLAEIYGAAPISATADHYARLVADESTRRRLIQAATKITQTVRDGVPADDAVQYARAWVDDCQGTAHGATGYVGDYYDEMLESLKNPPLLTPTPWKDLNHIIGGWRPGALYIIGARPGVGKTLASTQIAVELARTGHVAVSNLEMSRREILIRMTAQVAGVHLGRILDGRLTSNDWMLIDHHRDDVISLPMSIDDTSGATIAHIRGHARSVARKGNLVGVVVDYIGLMESPAGPYRPRTEVVSEFSRSLKNLASELEVPVIVLSQLNRNGAGTKPKMEDLRESGSLEQDADVVMLMHVDPEGDGTEIEIGIPKNRHGPQGDLKLVRRGHLARLDDGQWSPTDVLSHR
jgi:replicative DNA helicase